MTKKSIGLKKRVGAVQRKEVTSAQEAWVQARPLYPDRHIPLLITPAVDGVDLMGWAQNNRAYIEELLLAHRALLFRGFPIRSPEDFETFVNATSDSELLEYVDRTTPRHSEGGVSDRVYISTIYPAEHEINPHNEGTYWTQWARKLYFCCLTAPQEGGETPIFDVQRVYERIPPEVRERFVRRGWMLVRNYQEGFGLPWQEVFQVKTPAQVEEYCRQHDIDFEWFDGGHLRTRSMRPAVQVHPKTGDLLWFNHSAFYHHTTLDPVTRDALVAEFGMQGLPYNTWFGDGSPIDPADIEAVRAAYAEEKVKYRWLLGDVLLLDNMYIAHAREPYKGDRRIVVAMTEPVGSNPYQPE